MDALPDSVVLSRLQFAWTTLFHMLWPVITIGLSLWIVVLELLWLRTKDLDYYRHARFWTKLFILCFGIGVVTGVPLEFEFGTNWAPFAISAGDFFGNILGFEGAMAFMLEAGFLGIMVFGWHRVPPGAHAFATSMVALGASGSAFWIMAANAWMQTPAGGEFVDGRFIVGSYTEAIFNPNMPWAVAHMWMACIATSVFAIGGICAWYILKGVHTAFFAKALRLCVLAALIVAPAQILLGDGSGTNVFEHQPAKGAAIEGHWDTNAPGQGAAWSILAWPDSETERNLWSIEIPNLLSWLATKSSTGEVTGLRDIPVDERPPMLPLLYYSFRVMVAIGLFFLVVATLSAWVWKRGGLAPDRITQHRRMLKLWVIAGPLGFVAVEAGWIVREVGRQPWIIYGVMRTSDGASDLPAASIAVTLIFFLVTYSLLFLVFVVFFRRLLARGPDMKVLPNRAPSTTVYASK